MEISLNFGVALSGISLGVFGTPLFPYMVYPYLACLWPNQLFEKESALYSDSRCDVGSERNSKRSEMSGILWESGSFKSRRCVLKDEMKCRFFNFIMMSQLLQWCTIYLDLGLICLEPSELEIIGDAYKIFLFRDVLSWRSAKKMSWLWNKNIIISCSVCTTELR